MERERRVEAICELKELNMSDKPHELEIQMEVSHMDRDGTIPAGAARVTDVLVDGKSIRYEVYRRAGELYGRLHEAIGFGDLKMTMYRDAFLFRWRFHEELRGSYGLSQAVSIVELENVTSFDAFAEHIVTEFKEKTDAVRTGKFMDMIGNGTDA